MILVDTSVWIDHLRAPIEELQALLESSSVLMHPFVIGEIGLGSIPRYDFTMRGLSKFPLATKARDDDVLYLVREHRLYGRGVGYIDVHLLASTLLTPEALLWTRDKRLTEITASFGVSYNR